MSVARAPRKVARIVCDVGADRFERHLADGDQPLLAPLADRHQVTGVEVDIAQPQLAELRDAQARGVQRLDHRAVTTAARRAPVGRRQQAVDLGDGQVVGELAPEARQVDVLRRIGGDDPLALEEPEQLAQRHQPPRLRARRQLALVEVHQKIEDVDRVDVVRAGDCPPAGEVSEAGEVAPVGLHRRGRQLPFDPQVIEELLDPDVQAGRHAFMLRPSDRQRKFSPAFGRRI